MVDDWLETAGGCFVACIILIVIIVGVGLLFDGLQSVRSIDKAFKCEAANLESVRKTFTTQVVCRPRMMGSDTLHVQGIK